MKELIAQAESLKQEISNLQEQLDNKKKELSDIGDKVEELMMQRDDPVIVKINTTYYTVFRSPYGQVEYQPTEIIE